MTGAHAALAINVEYLPAWWARNTAGRGGLLHTNAEEYPMSAPFGVDLGPLKRTLDHDDIHGLKAQSASVSEFC